MSGAMPSGRLLAIVPASDEEADTSGAVLVSGPLTRRLLVLGLPVVDLAAGTRLRVGATAIVALAPEPAGGRTPELRSGVAESPGGVAVAARVVEGGPVRVGDTVVVDAVALAPGDVLDLHSFRPEEIPDVVRAYLDDASSAGLTEVRIVHGRGRGVQRAIVRRLLGGAPQVAAFADAPEARGGWGATVVRLRHGPPAAAG